MIGYENNVININSIIDDTEKYVNQIKNCFYKKL